MILKPIKKRLKPVKSYIDVLKRDLSNQLKYGPNAPKHLELIWVNPENIDHFINKEEIIRITGKQRQDASGVVIDGNMIKNITPLQEDFRYRYSFERWKDGKSWEEIGVYEYMKNETIKYKDMSQAELELRYTEFDRLYAEIKKEKRLKSRQELNPKNFREKDGILIHIGKKGSLYFGGIGFHRFSIAKVLGIKKIPACVGIVDKSSIKYLKQYRNKKVVKTKVKPSL